MSRNSPVGSFPSGRSPFGCLDMAGNVREWVEDGDGSDMGAPKQRGGDWTMSSTLGLQTFFRGGDENPIPIPKTTGGEMKIGFRVCLSHGPQ